MAPPEKQYNTKQNKIKQIKRIPAPSLGPRELSGLSAGNLSVIDPSSQGTPVTVRSNLQEQNWEHLKIHVHPQKTPQPVPSPGPIPKFSWRPLGLTSLLCLLCSSLSPWEIPTPFLLTLLQSLGARKIIQGLRHLPCTGLTRVPSLHIHSPEPH